MAIATPIPACSPARRTHRGTVAAALVLAIMLGVGCTQRSKTSTGQRHTAAVASTSATRTVGVCLDRTGSVPLALSTTAKDSLAGQLADSVTGPEAPLSLYVRAMDADSYTPEAALLPEMDIPGVPPRPTSVTDTNPYDAAGKAADKKTNARRLAAWNTQLAAAQRAAAVGAAQLRGLQIQPDERATDVLGCPLKLAELFPPAGDHRLLIVSDLVPDGPQQIGARLSLAGVQVTIDLWCDGSALQCEQRRATWTELLQRADAGSIRFVDQSQGIPDVVG